MRPLPDLLILDGATGTELDRRGVDVTLPLWSARALLEAPDVLAEVHRDYLEAGAGAVTTATFRTHRRTLAKAGLAAEAPRMTRRAVEIARAARDELKPEALVLGSVAPLEDCYRPDLAPGPAVCLAEHAEMVGLLLEAGADAILIETMNTLHEAAAAVEAARAAGAPWIASFCTRSTGPPGILLSGEPLSDLAADLHDAAAAGVNCVAAPAMEAQVRLLRTILPPHVRVSAYANIGAADVAGNWITSDAVSPARYAEYARRWISAGATIVGGCCGTTPDTIRAVAREIQPG